LVEIELGRVATTDRCRWAPPRYFVPFRQASKIGGRWTTRTQVVVVSIETWQGEAADHCALVQALEAGRVELIEDTSKRELWAHHGDCQALLMVHGVAVAEPGAHEPSPYHCQVHMVGGDK
jgi:hypothetical protein